MHKYYFSLVSFILLQGCSSIEQPIASRPLVEQEYIVTTPVENDDMQALLSTVEAGKTVKIAHEKVTLGPEYFSASGKTCRKASNLSIGQILFCQNKLKQWYRVKSVISQYNENTSEVTQ